MSDALAAKNDRKAGSVSRLRGERDRFVAFAFSAADILFELDTKGVIVHAAGALLSLIQQSPEELAGQKFLDLVDSSDRPVMLELLRAFASGRRLEPMSMRLKGHLGPTPPLLLVGYQLPDLDEHFFLALRSASRGTGSNSAEATRDLKDSETFTKEAVARMESERAQNNDVKMSLVEISNLDSLKGRLDSESGQQLLHNIAGFLKASSIDGNLAGDMGDGRYGVVHTPDVDVEELGARIEAYAREADPEGDGVNVASATVDLESSGLSDIDAGNALVYALHRFSNRPNGDMSLDNIAASLPAMLEQAGRQMLAAKRTIRDAIFDVAFQPIVDLKTRIPSHYEALARFNRGELQLPTFEFIEFSEKMGLIAEFDLAMCERVIAMLNGMIGTNPDCRVAVNISGSSLETPWYQEALMKLLKANEQIARRLLFEITESMALKDPAETNHFIQELRAAGHEVCLDDFGAGAAAFEYLRELEVDVVKIDGAYMRDSQKSVKGGRLFKGMVSLCRDLGVKTVAEFVEDEKSVEFLLSCGVDYGQGYLFGRPGPSIATSDASTGVRVDLKGRRQVEEQKKRLA